MTKAKFLKRCNELNVKFSFNGYTYSIEAPDKMKFGTYDTHFEDIVWNNSWRLSDIYNEFYHIMSMGLIACDDQDCEYCNSI
jgi:hypothetical protein